MSGSKKLDFAIVGAPKCGTTSIFESLNEREDLSFLGKDSHLFGQDLDLLLRDHSLDIQTELNKHPSGCKLGDASVWYLFSVSAAQELFDHNPNMKIVICLRNPLELIPSLHNQHLKGGDETKADLNEALNQDFSEGLIAEGVHFRKRPRYLESVDFPEQIERFKSLFKQVHFIFHKDLKNDFKGTINKLEVFLGLETRADIHKNQTNKRVEVTKPGLVKVIKKKPALLRSVFRTAIPSKKLRHKLMSKAMDSAIKDGTSIGQSLNQENTLKIVEQLEKQLPILKELTGVDCSHWINRENG